MGASQFFGTPFTTGSCVRLRWVLTIMVAKSAYFGSSSRHLSLGFGFGQPGDAVGAVYFLRYECYAITQFHFKRIQVLESVFSLHASITHPRVQEHFTTLEPML